MYLLLKGMNSKPALSITAIAEFFGDYFAHASKRGENSLNSNHLLNFTYDGELSMIRARVQASMRNDSYTCNGKFK